MRSYLYQTKISTSVAKDGTSSNMTGRRSRTGKTVAALVVACVVLASTVRVVPVGARGAGATDADGETTTDADATTAQQSTLRVENPGRDNVDGDGNTGDAETADGDDVYGSIQAAVDAAGDGDRIEVTPGTYDDPSVAVTDDVTLVAPEGATLSGTDGGVAITITNDAAATVSGFTIEQYDGLGVFADSDEE